MSALAAAVLWIAPVVVGSESTQLAMPSVFGDHMVLQRESEVPVWGTAPPGSEVVVSIAGQRKATVADERGDWRVRLEPLPAGGPHELVVEGDSTIRFADVLVGEVWLASGQSNMEMPLAGWGRVLDYEIEIERADYPSIRFFNVARATAMRPLSDVTATGWQRSSPETAPDFSATAYFFARRIHRETGLPMGIIQSSWGGTVAEAWTSADALAQLPDFATAVRRIRSTTNEEVAAMRAAFEEAMAERARAVREDDAGLAEGSALWAAPELDVTDWSSMALPSKWEDAELPDLDGVVWFRREVEIPASWSGRELQLSLGPIDDADQTFFNGRVVGETDGWDVPRRYRIPAELVATGRAVIAVRVLDTYLSGGLWGEAADLTLAGPERQELPLAGEWRYRVGLELAPLPVSPDDPNLPTVLYNAMIRPLAPYGIRGVLWYQGESNSSRASQYRTLFPTLIRDWRATWDQGDVPFFFVQLAGFEPSPLERGKWPELREAQAMALELPATGMAVAIDLGNRHDVHPKNKQEVGNRLARLALRRLYGADLADTGPVLRSAAREGSRLRLAFDHTDGGLEAKGGALRGFTVAGGDRLFRPAHARIEGEMVVVWSDEIASPVAVRYGWADYSDCNLYNAVGLPAPPFRTDGWPGLPDAQ